VETAGLEIFSLGKQVKGLWRYKSRVGAKFALFGFEGEGTLRCIFKESEPECCFSSFFPSKEENIFPAFFTLNMQQEHHLRHFPIFCLCFWGIQ
jgi:hypothetical protein